MKLLTHPHELRTAFPKDFLWAVATASYQVEGAVNRDGRGRSIWDVFSHSPGKVFEGHTGDVACDQYHRYEQDASLMRDLGVGAYRFSIAWPRIFPEGTGKINQGGIDYYKRLCDALLKHDITPVATLYHWDLPQSLQDRGGWELRDTSKYFTDYAAACFAALSDRIPRWITLNEPWCTAFLGNLMGSHAPGKTDRQTAYSVTHHLLWAHGLAVQAFRDAAIEGEIGIALNLQTPRAVSDAPQDQEAEDRSWDEASRLFLDPLFGRGYPSRLFDAYPDITLPIKSGDAEIIASPMDFLGMNYYTEAQVTFDSTHPEKYRHITTDVPKTDMDWDIVPEGLLRQLRWVHKEYGPIDLYITENGAAFPDTLEEGACNDEGRIAYLHAHFSACAEAIQEGLPLKGYFLWSFIDNFEWSYGFSKRFGIVYCDYKNNLVRIPKKSFYWYQKLISK